MQIKSEKRKIDIERRKMKKGRERDKEEKQEEDIKYIINIK